MSTDAMEQWSPLPATGQLRQRKPPYDGEFLRLLLIEDCRVDACVIQEHLASTDDVSIELEHVQRLSAGLSRLKDRRFDAVVVDLNDNV